jgi:hypothetical protein
MYHVVHNQQARAYCTNLCGWHLNKPVVPAANCRMGSFQSFRKHGMWVQHFSNRIVHAHIPWMSSSMSCMMCSILCPVVSITRTLQVWVVLTTMFSGPESQWLFPLRLLQTLCIPNQPAYYSGTPNSDTTANFEVHLQGVYHQAKGSHIEHEFTHTHKFSMKVSFHLCIIHILLYSMKLWIYHTSKLLPIFMNMLYKRAHIFYTIILHYILLLSTCWKWEERNVFLASV